MEERENLAKVKSSERMRQKKKKALRVRRISYFEGKSMSS